MSPILPETLNIVHSRTFNTFKGHGNKGVYTCFYTPIASLVEYSHTTPTILCEVRLGAPDKVTSNSKETQNRSLLV